MNKPLYTQMIEYIKKKIALGEFAPGQSIPNEKELAELFNVSRITSKKALEELHREGIIYRKRKSGSFVSPLQNANVAENLSENNKKKISNIISMVLPFDAADGGMMSAVKGAAEILDARGYLLTINNTYEDIDKEKEVLQNLINTGVAGIILYPFSDKRANMELLTNLCMSDYPIVSIDKYFEGIPLSYVVSDNFDGGYKVAQYLIDRGHRRIAYISNISIEAATSVKSRYLGYCTALKNNGIKIDDKIVMHNYLDDMMHGEFKNDHQAFCKQMIHTLMQNGVTAIQVINDIIAVHLERACTSMGVKIPEDLSITGFDNTEIAEHIDIPLTTVQQNFYEMGRRAAEITLEKIDEKCCEHRKIVLPVRLIERQSTSWLTDQQEIKVI